MLRYKILAAVTIAASAAFFAAVYTDGTTARSGAETGLFSTSLQPGTRCTRMKWPKLTKKEKADYKAGNFSALSSRCMRMYGKKKGKLFPNQPPVINGIMPVGSQPNAGQTWAVPSGGTLSLTTNASDLDGDTLLYTYSATGGRVRGDGASVIWDLNGVRPGTYTISSEVDDGCGCIAFSSATAEVNPN